MNLLTNKPLPEYAIPKRFDDVRLDSNTLFEWIGQVHQLRTENKHHFKRIEELSRILTGAGFRFCILKGHSYMYAIEMSDMMI